MLLEQPLLPSIQTEVGGGLIVLLRFVLPALQSGWVLPAYTAAHKCPRPPATITYSEGAWHLGAVKRVFLRATLFHLVGSICWIIESKGSTPQIS